MASKTSTNNRTHLLIDGDIIAFVAAAAAQQAIIDTFGYARHFAHVKQGEAVAENMLWALKEQLKADTCEVFLSDPVENWRREIDPNYKRNRVGERPLLLDYLKEYLREKHGAEHWPGLEADDVLSIKMTEPEDVCTVQSRNAGARPKDAMAASRLICVGRDKDFKSIPGLHHAWKQDIDARGNFLVREVSLWEADRFHLMQTLAGDRIDGFEGCPGIGMQRAAQIIDAPMRLVPQEGVKTRGVNKGEAVTRWMSEPTRDYWAAIVSNYMKAGLTEADALKTARLARLLRYGEYDRKTEEITLWSPDMIRRGGTMQ